ncbi:hypothetical protein Tco_0214856 [Tanacetum coccineum]
MMMTLEEQSSEERGSESDSDDDTPSSINVESSRPKKLKKFGYITESSKRIKGKDFLYKALGQDVVEGFFNKRIVYDRRRIGVRYAEVFNRMKKKVNDNMSTYLEIRHSIALTKQDPMLKLNKLARKKRRNLDEAQDYYRSTKRYKALVQFGER